MNYGGVYQTRFVPDDGRAPVVIARNQTVAGAQNRFALHVADLLANGEQGMVELVNAERRGRFTGQAIRQHVLKQQTRPQSNEPGTMVAAGEPGTQRIGFGPVTQLSAAPKAIDPPPSRPWWRFWKR